MTKLLSFRIFHYDKVLNSHKSMHFDYKACLKRIFLFNVINEIDVKNKLYRNFRNLEQDFGPFQKFTKGRATSFHLEKGYSFQNDLKKAKKKL